ncbi:MAG: hypothetical protein KDA85_09495 [Planctomycetaceae bacterium]|nr:hypothetical protein [Planctomycetaceae bacterium]
MTEEIPILDDTDAVRYRHEFYPAGFRKLMAIMLITSVTVLPEVFSWVGPPEGESTINGIPTGRYAPRGGFLPGDSRPRYAAPQTSFLKTVWTAVKRCFVVVVTTLGVVLYYPRRGFKRYALLCGPVIALLVPLVMSLYLRGRTEVFRAEILVVALIALSPGIGLYVLLTWRKAKRLGMEW